MSAEPEKRPTEAQESQFPRDAQVLWELLEFAPVSLWLEDWSRIKHTLDGWRANGITDPVAYAAADPARVEILARGCRVVDVNATSVSVYAAPDKTSLIADFERHAVEMLCSDMRNFFLGALAAFERGEKQLGVEAWERRYDGERIRVHISCSIAPGDKKWERALLAIKDVTEAWQTRAALDESRDLLSRAAGLARLAHWIIDCTTGAIIHCGEEIFAITGRRPEEWCRLVAGTEIEACIAPEDRTRYHDTVPPALGIETPYTVEYRLWQPDGSERWVRERGAPLRQANAAAPRYICTLQDMTEQRQAEAAKHDAQSQLQGFLENAPFAMFVKDLDRRYTYANRRTAMRLGRPNEEIIGHRAEEMFLPEAADIYRRQDDQVVATRAPAIEESRVMGPTGEVWAELIRFPIFDDAGEVRAIGGMAIDIAEIKRAEQELREQHEFLRLVIDSAAAYIMVFDGAGRLATCNKAYEEFCGMPFEALSRDDGWTRTVLPEDMPAVRQTLDPQDATKFPNDDTTRGVRADGDVRLIHWVNAAQTDADRRVKFIVCIGTDITEVKRAQLALQESEANLRAVVEGIVEAIVTFDERGIILSASSAAERMFGHNEAVLVGRELSMLLPGLPGQQNGDGAAGCLAAIEAGVGKSQELEAVARNGQHLTVAFSVNELPASGGRRRFVGTILDLTQHKALEDRLRQAQKMETIGQFTGGIAHDFNNLLAVIIGNLDLLASRASDERARKLVDRASGAAQRGADLTQRLLAFARRQRLEPVAVDLGALVQEIIPLAERTAGPEIQIMPIIDAGLWGVLVDRVQLEAALLNLIGNARDAMVEGGELVIRVANHTVDTTGDTDAIRLVPGRYVEIAVVDSGGGMPPEVVKRAFEPFFTTKGVGQGTGLGLSMVHGFVRQSGGDARIVSTTGAGTMVCLYLPATDRPVEAAESAEATVAHAGQTGQRVLVVDDEPEVLTLVKELLAALGYHVDGAASGGEALERLRQPVAYDLLLTDVRMKGGISGPQLAAQAKALRPTLKVLFMSGFDDAVGTSSGIPKGADLLHKPFRNDDLAQGVARALGA